MVKVYIVEALPYFDVSTIYIKVFIFYLNLNRKSLLICKCEHELLFQFHVYCNHIFSFLMLLPFVQVNKD